MHFGHCSHFALVEADPATGTIASVTFVSPPAHAPGVLPRWLHSLGVNTVIAGGIGQRAQGMFEQCGIEVISGAGSGTPEEIAAAYMRGELEIGRNVCDH